MHRTIKKTLHRLGIKAFRLKTIPRGIELEVDISRILTNTEPLMIFDVGANLGQTSEKFIESFPSAKILAFEPVGTTFQALQRKASRWPQIQAHQMALGEKDGEALMEIMPESGWNRVVDAVGASSNNRHERVTMARIDTFCTERDLRKIHLLKTDCEGYDLSVLKGAHEMLAETH